MLLASPRLPGADVRVFEAQDSNPAWLLQQVYDFEPDVVGASCYLWSFPTMVEVARQLRRERPETLIVFGGPSARPSMFALPPFRLTPNCVDALAVGEGEEVFEDIVAIHAAGGNLAGVPGLQVPTPGGWRPTAPRTTRAPLDAFPSPYQMGLMPRGHAARLQPYRGCPMGCAFCQMAGVEPPDRVLSVEYLTRELAAFQALEVERVCLDSAGLNLNSRAFANLAAAEQRVGCLAERRFDCEVYPSHLTRAQLAFLRNIRIDHVGIGMQSLDGEVLTNIRRRFAPARLEDVIRALREDANIVATVELILGLPGETPRTLATALDYLDGLPCTIRVSHCRVLPDALMDQAPPEAKLEFDPFTLKLTSSASWSAGALADTRAAITERARLRRGRTMTDWWEFPATALLERGATCRSRRTSGETADPRGAADTWSDRAGPAAAGAPLPPGARRPLEQAIARVSRARWRLAASLQVGETIVLQVATPEGDLWLEVCWARPGARSFCLSDGLAWSYRSGPPAPAAPAGDHSRASSPSPQLLRALRGLLPRLGPSARAALPAPPAPAADD